MFCFFLEVLLRSGHGVATVVPHVGFLHLQHVVQLLILTEEFLKLASLTLATSRTLGVVMLGVVEIVATRFR